MFNKKKIALILISTLALAGCKHNSDSEVKGSESDRNPDFQSRNVLDGCKKQSCRIEKYGARYNPFYSIYTVYRGKSAFQVEVGSYDDRSSAEIRISQLQTKGLCAEDDDIDWVREKECNISFCRLLVSGSNNPFIKYYTVYIGKNEHKEYESEKLARAGIKELQDSSQCQ